MTAAILRIAAVDALPYGGPADRFAAPRPELQSATAASRRVGLDREGVGHAVGIARRSSSITPRHVLCRALGV